MINKVNNNPWIARYLGVMSDRTIQQLTELHGEPVIDLTSELIEVACERLRKALDAVFIATKQCRNIMRSELERAVAHGTSAYPNQIRTLQAIYSPPPRSGSHICQPASLDLLGQANRSWKRHSGAFSMEIAM